MTTHYHTLHFSKTGEARESTFPVVLPILSRSLFFVSTAVAVFLQAESICFGQTPPASPSAIDNNAEPLVEVPLDIGGNHPVVEAEFLGETRRFVIDTGASMSFLDRSYRKRLGPSQSTQTIRASSGDFKEEIFDNQTFSIGGQTFSGRIALHSTQTTFHGQDSEIVGVLGMDCFQDFALQLDPTNEVMRVYVRVPADISDSCASFPIRNLPQNNVLLTSVPEMGLGEFLLDTGATQSLLLRPKVFDALFKSDEIQDVSMSDSYATSTSFHSKSGRIKEFVFGPFRHKLLDAGRGTTRSIIGWNYLLRFITTIDFPRGTLYVRPSKFFDVPDSTDKSGLSLISNEDGLFVYECFNGSPSKTAGLQSRDRITFVNEKAAAEYTWRELTGLLSRDGENVKISAVRGETTLHAEFRLQEYRSFLVNPGNEKPKSLATLSIQTDCDAVVFPVQAFGEAHLAELALSSSTTVFDTSLRLELGDRVRARQVAVGSAKTQIDQFPDTSVQLGNFSLKASSVICDALGPLRDLRGQQIDCMMGIHNFFDVVVELDLSSNRIQLYDRVPTAVVESSECLPLMMDHQGMRVTGLVAGYDSEQFRFASSSSSLTLSRELFQKLKSSHEIRRVHELTVKMSNGNERMTELGVLGRFMLGPFEHTKLEVLQVGESSSIGMNYMRRYIAVFDFPNKELYLRESKEFADPEEPLDVSGLFLVQHDGQFIVEYCQVGAPAAEAGLLSKDRILEVNGRSAEDYSLEQLRRMLRREGDRIAIVAKRDDNSRFTVEFRLRDYREYQWDPELLGEVESEVEDGSE